MGIISFYEAILVVLTDVVFTAYDTHLLLKVRHSPLTTAVTNLRLR